MTVTKEHAIPPFRNVHREYTIWHPFPKVLHPEWVKFARQRQEELADSLRHKYILNVRYNAGEVKEVLRQWGLPCTVVMAGWLWECDLEIIRNSELEDSEEVVRLIQGTNKYVQYIEDDNLPALFIPPYPDLDALLIAVAIYKVSLHGCLQFVSEPKKIRGLQEKIKRIVNTLLNITKRFGMWYLKREIEDLCFQVLNPEQFASDQAEHNELLEQDKERLEKLSRLLTIYIEQLGKPPVYVTFAPCGIAGLRRRIQEAHTTVTTRKTRLTGLDLVTFDILVSDVSLCYQALGFLGRLGRVQDRITDHIAQPKSNGFSYIAFGLTIDPQHPLVESMQIKEAQPINCQVQIGTIAMQAITAYGCLYPRCHSIYQQPYTEHIPDPPFSHKYMDSDEGKALSAIRKAILDEQLLWAEVKDVEEQRKRPIVVYNKKGYKPVRMPRWATAQDFIYIEFPAFNEQNVEVIVNNRKAPLYRTIEIGDVIEVIIGDAPRASYASIPETRRKLTEQYSSNTTVLDMILDCINHKFGYALGRKDMMDELKDIVVQYQLDSLKTYMQRIYDNLNTFVEGGDEKNTIQWVAGQIIHRVIDRSEEVNRQVPVEIIKTQQHFFPQQFCERCQPTYPVKIVGVLQERNKKITIHGQGCRYLNYKNIRRDSYIALEWRLLPFFRIVFHIDAQDRRGLIFDITRQLRYHQCLLRKVNADASEGEHLANIQLVVETHDLREALDIREKIVRVAGVKQVTVDRYLTPSHVYTQWEKLTNSPGVPVESPMHTVMELESRDIVLRNPFDISRPATGKMFFGYKEQLKTMNRELCGNEKGRAVLIHGPRRSGKSSLCSAFLEQYVSPPMWFVNCSLQGEERHNEEEILRKLASEIIRTFRKQFHQQFPYWLDFAESDPQLRFQYVLEECLQRVPGSRLVLVLDEFGGVLTAFQNGMLERRFFTFWRGLMAKFDQLSLILVIPTNAYITLRELEIDNALSFARKLEVPFLDGESAQRLLIDTLLRQRVLVDTEVAAAAMKLTAGNPYFMQLLGMYLVHLLNRNPKQQYVTIADLEAVRDTILQEDAANYFDFYHDEVLNKDEMDVLRNIMESMYIHSKDRISLKSLAQRMRVSAMTLRPLLDRMKAGLLVEEYGTGYKNLYYSYKIELACQWMQFHQDFFKGVRR